MNLLKDATIETIKHLPDGCSLEDIMYEINFVAQVLDGLKDAEAKRTINIEEFLDRVQKTFPAMNGNFYHDNRCT